MSIIGEVAALFTSLCWSLSAIGFTKATRQVGSIVTNRVRLLLAMLMLILINAILYRQPIPLHAESSRWIWLSISGIIGLSLGDIFLFQAYKEVGPRLGLLLLSLAPVFGAAIAWIFFGQALGILEIVGIIITLAGIAWVVLARPKGQEEEVYKVNGRGVFFGVMAAIGQATGLVLSQQGMAGNFSPFAGTLIRMIAAFAAIWIVTLFQRQAGATIQAVRSYPAAFGWVAFGALFGPVIGVSASLLAVQHANIGVASTLMALPPVFMLPISYFLFKERFGWQVVAGTLIAIAGVALLFF
ncbi:MAG TPA: DMT family transporter [Anaerolineales bacterium]|nr:DMT family transporter [Anaerolineales bacterium]